MKSTEEIRKEVKEWLYDEDNSNVMCRCPDCGGRLLIGLYTYWNPYRYCPYCGQRLMEGQITKKRVQVYNLMSAEEEERVREEYGRNG